MLVVDDAEDLRGTGRLCPARRRVCRANGGERFEALFAAYEMQPAVIVMDMKMPLLDGIEATRLIKATEATRHAKIIAHTADPSLPDPVVQRLFAAVLPKPSPPDVVLTAGTERGKSVAGFGYLLSRSFSEYFAGCNFSRSGFASWMGGMRYVMTCNLSRERPWAARDGLSVDCHRRSSDASIGSGPEPHRHPHRNGQGRTGRRPCGCARPVSSPALIGGPATTDHERERATALPGSAAGSLRARRRVRRDSRPTTKRTSPSAQAPPSREPVVLTAREVSRNRSWSREPARASTRADPGFGTRFGPEDLDAIPTRRSSMFDWVKAAPGISPTSPASASTTRLRVRLGRQSEPVSHRRHELHRPSNGVARADPGIDFIQEAADPVRGRVRRVRQCPGRRGQRHHQAGSDRFLYDASYYCADRRPDQPAGTASSTTGSGNCDSGYERARYRDFTTTLGGPAVRDRLWFFAGYQYLRDYDSQPGTDPALPEDLRAGQDLREAHLATGSGLAVGAKLSRRVLGQPRAPTFDEAVRRDPARRRIGAGHELRPSDAHVVGQYRVGRARRTVPSSRRTTRRPRAIRRSPSRVDQPGQRLERRPAANRRGEAHSHDREGDVQPLSGPGCWAPITSGRSAGKSTGASTARLSVIPTGVRYVYNNGVPSQPTLAAIPPTQAAVRHGRRRS